MGRYRRMLGLIDPLAAEATNAIEYNADTLQALATCSSTTLLASLVDGGGWRLL